MRHNSLLGFNQFIVFITLIWLIFSSTERVFAGTSVEDIQKYLAARAELEDNELIKLKNGEIIAKLLPAQDKREVAVFGIIQIKTPLDVGLQTFQETMARQNKKSIMEFGSFSVMPTIEDLKNLTLEKGDIEDLKQCRIGNCGLKLSEAMIKRFQKEVDWNAPDYSIQATILFRRLIVDYVENYLSQGNSALIEYSNQRDPGSLQKEQSSLLRDLIWINEFAPEFSQYLDDSSRSELPNLRKTVNWTKLKFGLKPVIIITQTVTYQAEQCGDLFQILSVSKQIYASRYFDSSLGLTALIKSSQTETTSDSYLLYTNHSRSSSLNGLFSKFKHEIIEDEALRKLRILLQDTKLYGEAKLPNQNELPASSTKETVIEWLADKKYLILLILTIGLIATFGLSKRNQN